MEKRSGKNARPGWLLLGVWLLCLLICTPVMAVNFLDDEPVEPVHRTLMQWSQGNGFGGGPADRDSPLIGDRPDFVESAVTVGLGVLQLEMGYTFIYDNDGSQSVRSHGYPEALFRYGVWKEWFELRLMFSFLDEETVSGGTSSRLQGSEDIYLGAKIAIAPQEGFLPETGIMFNMMVPSGSANISDGEVLPGVSLLYSWEFDNGWALGGQTQGNRALDPISGNAYTEMSQALSIETSLNDRVGYYFEWFCLIPSGAETMKTEHYLDSGFTFLVHNDLQLDIRAGIGLGDAAADYFFGSGLIRRF